MAASRRRRLRHSAGRHQGQQCQRKPWNGGGKNRDAQTAPVAGGPFDESDPTRMALRTVRGLKRVDLCLLPAHDHAAGGQRQIGVQAKHVFRRYMISARQPAADDATRSSPSPLSAEGGWRKLDPRYQPGTMAGVNGQPPRRWRTSAPAATVPSSRSGMAIQVRVASARHPELRD